jgi:hypothetical protein
MTSEQTERTIERLLEDLIANPTKHRWGVCRENAKRLGALPVFGDFGGFLFVAPDGRVLSVDESDLLLCGYCHSLGWTEPGVAQGRAKVVHGIRWGRSAVRLSPWAEWLEEVADQARDRSGP